MNINNENVKKRVEFFKERDVMVHVSRKDGRFFNGKILEVGTNFFIIKDKVTNFEIMVLFDELQKPLEKYYNPDNDQQKSNGDFNS